MDLSALTYGQIVFYAGIILVAVGVIAISIGLIIFAGKRKRLKKQLVDKYGF